MSEKSILNKVRTMLGITVALEQLKLDNGTVVEADAFEPLADIMVVTEEGSIPLPAGDYTLEDGRKLVCQEDGVIAEIKEAAPAEEAPASEPEMAQDAPAPQASAQAKKVIESVTKETVFSAEEVDALKAELEAVKTELASMKAEPKEEPETPAFKHSPEKETEKTLFKLQPKKPQTTIDRVMAAIANN